MSNYIIDNIKSYFNQDVDPNDKNLLLFLEDPNSSLLSVWFNSNTNILNLSNKLETSINNEKIIYFIKTNHNKIDENHSNIIIINKPAENNPLSSFYTTLNTIFVPLLSNINHIDQNIIKNLNELQKNIKNNLYSSNSINDDNNVTNNDNLDNIKTLSNEVEYWQNNHQSKYADTYANLCQSLANDFEQINNNETTMLYNDVIQLIEESQSILNELFIEEHYPQKRMIHIFDIISMILYKYIINKVKDLDLWLDHNYFQIKRKI